MIVVEETKQCTCCGEVKALTEFHKSKTRKDGFNCYCKACVKEYQQANHEKIKAYSVARAPQVKAYSESRPNERAVGSIKSRAKRKGLDFNLEVEDVIPPEFCPVLGLKLERNKQGGPQKNSPSVDRVDPNKGYVKGNIQIISHMANAMKQDATPEQLLMFADWIYKTYGKGQDEQK